MSFKTTITHEFTDPIRQTPGEADPAAQMDPGAEGGPRLGVGRKFAALRYALSKKPVKKRQPTGLPFNS